MLSIDILLEWREHFRRGVPVTVMIEAKIASIIKNHKGSFIIYTLGGGGGGNGGGSCKVHLVLWGGGVLAFLES